MPRVYSRTGCQRCKTRKKKCSEERPTCFTCAKRNWPCFYEAKGSVRPSSLTGPIELLTNSLTPVGHINDETEGKILQSIPDCVLGFFSPTSGKNIQDLQIMWQLMAGNELLRHAVIAFYSATLQNSLALTRLNQESYGKALRSLRSQVRSEENFEKENIICIIASIVFLGKMESFGPHSLADALDHWVALIPILGSRKVVRLSRQMSLPMSESMLIFESLLYHMGTHAIFSQKTEMAWQLWQSHGTYEQICKLNPDGPDRVSLSPLLCGRYNIYNAAFELSYLLQSNRDGHISWEKVEEMDGLICQQDKQLDNDFAVEGSTESAGREAAKYEAECAIYHLFCNSLLICLEALRAPSPRQRHRMEQLVHSGTAMFLKLPRYGDIPKLAQHANHFLLASIWPIQILGCAMYNTAQFEAFMEHYSLLEPYIDAGHRRRASSLFGRVAKTLSESGPTSTSDTDLEIDGRGVPAGLLLLRCSDGVQELG